MKPAYHLEGSEQRVDTLPRICDEAQEVVSSHLLSRASLLLHIFLRRPWQLGSQLTSGEMICKM